MSPYPCPACGAPADLVTGCSGCRRPPDAEAAEVTALDGAARELAGEVEHARQAYARAVDRLNEVIRRRNELVLRVQARSARPVVAVQPPGTVPPLAQPPVRPETSGRTVQNVLFVLGGLLLGSAAIVFTAVAWANFGIGGRAAILGAVTLLTLAVPPIALRRRLSGTAEVFAALGLLLLLLDGYAARSVNLAGLADGLSTDRYAGAVCAATATIGLGYGVATGLTGPRFAALALAQPVLPLVMAGSGLGPAGWAATLAVVAVLDLAAARVARHPVGLAVSAWVLAGLAGATAGLNAVVAALSAGDVAGTARAGVALVLVAALLVPAAASAPRLAWPRHVAGAVVAFTLAVAGARVLTTAWPGHPLALVAAEVLVLALVVRLLPGPFVTGTRTGVLAAGGLAACAGTVAALGAGVATARAALRLELGPTAARLDVELPLAIALLSLAIVALSPRRFAVPAAVAGGVLVALAVPAAVPLAWWAPSIVDGVLAVPLALAAGRPRSPGRPHPAVLGVAALILAGHAVTVGLAVPWSAAAVLAGLLGLAVAVAATGRRQPVVGAVAAGIGLLVPAGLGVALGQALGWQPRPLAAAGLVLSTAGALALARWVPGHAAAGAVGVLVAGLGVSVAATRSGWYAGLPVLCAALLGASLLPSLPGGTPGWYRSVHRALGGVLLAVPAVTVAPAVWALLAAPYAWLRSVWTGAPGGVGLVPAPGARLVPHGPVLGLGAAAVTLALLALAAGPARASLAARTSLAGRTASTRAELTRVELTWGRLARIYLDAVPWVAAPAGLAVLAGAAALDAPWPTVAALSLAMGAGTALVAALRPAPALALFAVPATGAALAQSLATRGATLTALSVVLVTAIVCGVAGRRVEARVAGWLAAVPAAAALALAAALAAEVSVRWAAFWVLAAAAAAIATSGVLPTRTERRLVEAAAHATAATALLLTSGSARYAAGVLTLWGVAVGLRALRPAEPAPGRRTRVVAGMVCELVAYWLVLGTGGVTVPEAYTLPAAGVALLAGWLATRTRPALHSWSAYGPGLLAGFAPSLAIVLAVPGEPLRRLALGLAGVAVVVAGSTRRRQAPVVVGGAVLVLLALHESALVWDLLPRWVPLGLAGLVLVGLAVTYERRRRDLRRLRAAVGGMR